MKDEIQYLLAGEKTIKFKEELEEMCNLSYGIEENAIERERFSTIINMLLDHVPKEKIKQYTNASDKEISDAENELLSKTK